MNIAFVGQPLDVFPSRGASMGTWTQELATRLAERHQVAVYCRDTPSGQQEEELESVCLRRFSIGDDERTVGRVQVVDRVLNKMEKLSLIRARANKDYVFYRWYYYSNRYFRAYIRDVAKEIRRRGADWIVLSNFSQFVPILRHFNPNAKILLNIQCDWLVELPERLLRRWLPAINAICGCSHFIANGVAGRFPRLAPKCYPLHNATNLETFGIGRRDVVTALSSELDLEDKRVVLFTGRICPEKGVHVLLKAMNPVLRELPNVALVIAGGFSNQPPSPKWIFGHDPEFSVFENLRNGYQDRLTKLSSEFSDRIHFVGNIPHGRLPDYYGLADVFVHPSVWREPFGMILTEAMSCGLPVISTRVGGIPEIVVDGETGVLVNPDDAQELGGAILRLLRDGNLRHEMGRRGAARVRECFSWEMAAEKLEEILCGHHDSRVEKPIRVPEASRSI